LYFEGELFQWEGLENADLFCQLFVEDEAEGFLGEGFRCYPNGSFDLVEEIGGG
jgi:hypothetical protein